MFPKSVINVCLCLFFVGLIVADDSAPQQSCYDRISGIVNGPGGRNLMGGWRVLENAQNDGVVRGIMASGSKQFNRMSNDLHQFDLFANGIVEAFIQLVNGNNYCVRFTLESSGCKNSMKGDYCRDGKQVTCSVQAYKAFQDQVATIDPEKLVCTPVA